MSENEKYVVWSCKIVVLVEHSSKIPDFFDVLPRGGAIRAVELAGIPVLACFSGWGGSLDRFESAILDHVHPDPAPTSQALSALKTLSDTFPERLGFLMSLDEEESVSMDSLLRDVQASIDAATNTDKV